MIVVGKFLGDGERRGGESQLKAFLPRKFFDNQAIRTRNDVCTARVSEPECGLAVTSIVSGE